MSEEKIASDQEHPGQYAVHAHISSTQFYVFILALLMSLTLLTVGVSYIHLGKLNLIVAVVIASIKATLVVLFFMHLKYDNKFNALILIVSLLFIGVFFAYTLNDTDHRAELDLEQGSKILPANGEEAPGGFAGHHAEAAGAGHDAPAPGGHDAPAPGGHDAPAPGGHDVPAPGGHDAPAPHH
jgi:cytochrome c oxidase subunit 4